MPISKIKGGAINDDAISTAKIVDDAVTSPKIVDSYTTALQTNPEFSGTEAARMPNGTTGQRTSAKTGDIRFNTTLSLMEYYDGTAWKSIDSPPVVSSISPTTETDANANIVITGSNFQSNATVKFVGNDGTEYNSPTVTVNSSTQVTATTPSSVLTVANEPYDVVVTNPSGLAGTGTDLLDAGGAPTWSTSAGNIGTVYEDVAIGSLSIAATDPDGQAVTYSSSDLSISGVTLNTNGTITGTPNVSDSYASNGVTHTFNGVASDGTNTTTRTFNILRKWNDGSTDAQAITSPDAARVLGLSNGTYKFKFSSYNSGNAFTARYATYNNRGWIEVLCSSSTNNDRPWLSWLRTSSAGYTGSLSSSNYYLRNHNNLSGGGIDYSQSNSVILLGNAVTWTDVAFTTKSSMTANGVTASGQNQSSNYPMIAGSGGGKNLTGSDAATVKTQLGLYFSGQRDGFHADRHTVDYDAYWPTSGSNGFGVILAKRDGSASSTEWHIAEGVDDATSTYAPNYGYRSGDTSVEYHTANVGAFNSSTSGKDTYAIGSSNVMSIWLTDA